MGLLHILRTGATKKSKEHHMQKESNPDVCCCLDAMTTRFGLKKERAWWHHP
jgi:hypothetical protein